MAEDKKTVETVPAEETSDLFVRFDKPYSFEGETRDGIDLSGLADVSGNDLISASSYVRRKGVIATMPETTMEFAFYIAGRVTELPVEFFQNLKARDALRLKNTVTNFFYGED